MPPQLGSGWMQLPAFERSELNSGCCPAAATRLASNTTQVAAWLYISMPQKANVHRQPPAQLCSHSHRLQCLQRLLPLTKWSQPASPANRARLCAAALQVSGSQWQRRRRHRGLLAAADGLFMHRCPAARIDLPPRCCNVSRPDAAAATHHAGAALQPVSHVPCIRFWTNEALCMPGWG